jgi:hypothetical protein
MFRNCVKARPDNRRAGGRLCRSATVLATAAATLVLGCGSASSRNNGRGGAGGQANQARPGASAGGSLADVFGDSGSSAERLHDLSGPLLAYYSRNRRLPETLEELEPLGGAGPKPDFTSPSSGKPLVYTPSAVPPAGDDRRLVLYDPSPTPRRTYWAILMGYPRGNQPPATWVVELPEHALRTYAAATTQPAAGVP